MSKTDLTCFYCIIKIPRSGLKHSRIFREFVTPVCWGNFSVQRRQKFQTWFWVNVKRIGTFNRHSRVPKYLIKTYSASLCDPGTRSKSFANWFLTNLYHSRTLETTAASTRNTISPLVRHFKQCKICKHFNKAPNWPKYLSKLFPR